MQQVIALEDGRTFPIGATEIVQIKSQDGSPTQAAYLIKANVRERQAVVLHPDLPTILVWDSVADDQTARRERASQTIRPPALTANA